MAEDSGRLPKPATTSDEEWSNYEEDSEERSDESGSGTEDDGDLTDRHSDDEEDDKRHDEEDDTETRNLLDDADFEEDVMFGDEEGVNIQTGIPDELDDEIYAMSQEQKNYYTDIFMHLQYLTQGDAHLEGAVSGSDDLIVGFFRKSGLETAILGQIWDLADVNIDGKLNRLEFCVAMHLIVLVVKGNIPVPKHLPAYFDLRATPQRLDDNSPRSSEGISVQSNGSVKVNGIDKINIGGKEESVKKFSLSDDKLHALAQSIAPFIPVTEFAADPPMCVDRVPVPIRSNHGSTAQLTGTHSLGSSNQAAAPISFSATLPKGPPPEPPPRAYQKGHTRSASLDLNAKPPIADFRCPGKLGLDSQQRCLTLPANTAPPPLSTPDSIDGIKQSKTLETMFSPSDYPSSSSESHGMMSASSSRQKVQIPPAIPLKPDYHSRCTVLRQVNAELESKLATLSQIRLQLKLRVEEVQGKATGPNLHHHHHHMQ